MKQASGAVPQTYVMMRLNRWTVWLVWKISESTTDPKPQHVQSWWWKMLTARHMQDYEASSRRAMPCPVDIIEAEETDRCVEALPAGLRRMVALAYLDRRPVKVKVAALNEAGMSISRRTYFRYLGRAYDALLGLFNDVSSGVPLPGPKKPTAAIQERPTADIA